MTKRKFIEKESLKKDMIQYGWNHPDSTVTEYVDDFPVFTEQDIVKPYLNKLKAIMKERDNDNGGEPLNAIDRGYHLAYEHLCEEIDNLLLE